ncbi:hypothetical protein JXC34_00205 [Candidatus Woesearchaeota archaeon]|nr:hypothetical protein [Candidatus Woesearchaeota archaeon]
MAKYDKIRARQVLDEIREREDLVGPIIDYFEALVDESLPPYYLDRFHVYRYEYSDDLPEPDFPKDHPDYVFFRLKFSEERPQMKCRGQVITGISVTLQSVITAEVLTDLDIVELIEQYKTKDWNAFKGRKGEYWTSEEEI